MKTLSWLLMAVFLTACLDEGLRFYVMFHHDQRLEKGSPVWMTDKQVGAVEQVTREKNGDWKVAVRIHSKFRQQVTEQSRFYVEPDPSRSNHYRLRIDPNPKGKPIAEGQIVEGSDASGDFLRPLIQGLSKGLGELERQLETFHKGLEQLPGSPEFLEFQRRMEELARQMREAEETMQYQTLPRLQQEMERLQRELEKALPPAPPEQPPQPEQSPEDAPIYL